MNLQHLCVAMGSVVLLASCAATPKPSELTLEQLTGQMLCLQYDTLESLTDASDNADARETAAQLSENLNTLAIEAGYTSQNEVITLMKAKMTDQSEAAIFATTTKECGVGADDQVMKTLYDSI